MTPTEQDKELREQLLLLYSANFNDGEPIEGRAASRDMFSVSTIVDFIDDFVVPLIIADRKRVALEARLDELEHLDDQSIGTEWKANRWFSAYDRMFELKAQQEEV